MPIEIDWKLRLYSMKYQWKSIGNQVEFSMKYLGKLNEIPTSNSKQNKSSHLTSNLSLKCLDETNS